MPASLSPEQLFGAEPHRCTLANGLATAFAPAPHAGLVSVQVWVKTGSIHEGALIGSGLSHYLEHMVFKGTKKYSCHALTQAVQAVGATMNAYTTFDRTVFHIDGPSEAVETAFDVLGEMMFHATLLPADTAREKEVILHEIDMRDDDPDSRLAEAMLAEAFRVHPYRYPVIGLRDAFARVTHEELLAYYRARYVPNNMFLAVAGTLEPANVLALAEKHFGAAPALSPGAPGIPPEPAQLATRRNTLHGDVQVLRGSMAWRIPGMRDPDSPALDVFTTLIGQGQSSRLHQRLHEELELVHQVDASNWAPGEAGLLWLAYTADLGRRDAVEGAVSETLDGVLRDGFTEDEFAKARRHCLMAFLEARKTVSGLATQLGAQSVIIGDTGYPRLYLERVMALTPASVLATAQRHLRPERLVCMALEPKCAATIAATASTRVEGPVPFQETRLGNGLRILLQPMRNHPKIHLRALLPGGGTREPKDRRGLCAMLATLMARDTEHRTAAQVAQTAEALGASLQESAGNNSFGLAIEVLPGDEDLAAELLSHGLILPSLITKTFMRERDAQRAAIREDEDDIVEYGRRRLRQHFLGEHPLAIDHLGRADDLASMMPADVRALHATLVSPANTILAISGDFDPGTMHAIVEKHFAHWRGAPASPPPPIIRTKALPARTGRIEETQPREQAVTFLAYPDTGIVSEDYIAGQLLDELLSGMASRLFTTVREERGMAYFVGASRVSAPDFGLFHLYAGTNPGNIEPVLEAMRAETDRMRKGDLTPAEIESGKMRLRTARRMAAQTPGARALNAALNALHGMEINREECWERQLAAQNAATLACFAQKHFREDACLAYIVKPEKA
jgi:zinc protease